ncbi:MAG: glycosyl hydrolase family 17 protein, partial [Planctomycetota bacterium]
KHPNKVVVIGEAGWATEMADHGEQAKLIKGQPGENEQKLFFDRYIAWLKQEKIPYFYFEAFDEPWKGGEDPREVEKHWGLFKEDRTRKAAIRRGE